MTWAVIGRSGPIGQNLDAEGAQRLAEVSGCVAIELRACDGCGTDLDDDGACPCCEGARA